MTPGVGSQGKGGGLDTRHRMSEGWAEGMAKSHGDTIIGRGIYNIDDVCRTCYKLYHVFII